MLTKRLERTIGFTMFSGQSLQTEWRLLTTISHTSHPVGWEEISARRQDVIDKAVSMLQESYQFTTTRRGVDLTEYLMCAPVLLAGEDVPVRSLLGKVVRCQLAGRKGELMPENLPRFPVREWLEFLAGHDRNQVQALFDRAQKYVARHARSSADGDDGAGRIRVNYAAVLTCWKLLTEFAGITTEQGDFMPDVLTEMNAHISETTADRDPWVWILEAIFDEISAGRYTYPHKFMTDIDEGVEIEILAIRPGHLIAHLKHSPALRATWDALPVKSKGVLLSQLKDAGVVYKERVDITWNNKREHHLIALHIGKLGEYDLHVSMPENMDALPFDYSPGAGRPSAEIRKTEPKEPDQGLF